MVQFNDSFTNTNGTTLTAHNANWVNSFNDTWSINTNAAYKSSATNNFGAYRWNQATAGDSQFAEGTVEAVAAGQYIGVGVRLSGNSGATSAGYWFLGTTTESFLMLWSGGVDTELASAGGFTAGDVIRIEAEGNAIRAYRNGVFVLRRRGLGCEPLRHHCRADQARVERERRSRGRSGQQRDQYNCGIGQRHRSDCRHLLQLRSSTEQRQR